MNDILGKEKDVNILKMLGVGNSEIGMSVLVFHQRQHEEQPKSGVSMEILISGEVKTDLDEYKVEEGKYHIENKDSMADIVISENEISIGFSCKDESTIQTITLKE